MRREDKCPDPGLVSAVRRRHIAERSLRQRGRRWSRSPPQRAPTAGFRFMLRPADNSRFLQFLENYARPDWRRIQRRPGSAPAAGSATDNPPGKRIRSASPSPLPKYPPSPPSKDRPHSIQICRHPRTQGPDQAHGRVSVGESSAKLGCKEGVIGPQHSGTVEGGG